MGRGGDGIEIREGAIRLGFTFDGKFRRHTLKVDGRPLAPTQANLKYARRLVDEIRARIRLGTFSLAEYFPASGKGPAPLTVAAQLDTWLGAQRIASSTRAGYTSAAKFWTAAIGDKGIRALRTSDVLTAIANHPMTGKTVNNYVSVLREAMQLAVTDKILTENPVAAVPRAKHQKEPPDPFTAGERDAIIAEVERRAPGQVANMVAFWFWTGLRTSEMFGLRWDHVDLASGYVSVEEAVVRGERKGTKTDTVRRVILNSAAMAALQRQRAHTQLAGDAVWTDPRYGTPWTEERAFRRSYWTPALKARGIRYRRPYACRHTYATAMLMAGMSPAFCAKQLGHSVEVFLSTYARWLDGRQDAIEMQRLEATIAQELPTTRAANDATEGE